MFVMERSPHSHRALLSKLSSNVCVCVCVTLTVVHVATVAEADAQHHGVLAGRTVSLGNGVSDAHSRSETISLFAPFHTKRAAEPLA